MTEINLLLIIILILSSALVFLLIFLANRSSKGGNNESSNELISWLKSTGERIDRQNRDITSVLESSSKNFSDRLESASRFIIDLKKDVGELSEIGRSIKELEGFLKSPKIRGNLGEYVLKEMLSRLLPQGTYSISHKFPSGATVDAIIKTEGGMIPIDSKFPFDNFRKMVNAQNQEEKQEAKKSFLKDVKKHIDDIAGKYILPKEDTVDYALMYLPSEAVYYEIVNEPSVFEYSSKLRVLPVSPVTLYAYLHAIVMSFEGRRIEGRAREILKILKSIDSDYHKTRDNLSLLSRHLTNAYNQMDNVMRIFSGLGEKIRSSNHAQKLYGKKKKTLP